MNSLITVIVPVYNVEKYIAECIESILKQSYSNIELLLVDDGSSDNSGKICDYYATIDKRIRVFHQSNQGVSHARNTALCVAKGEWVTFVDSDDTINPDYIESLVQANSKLDKQILAVSGATRIDRNDNICKWKQKFENKQIPLLSFSKGDYQLLDSILLFGTVLGKLYNLEIVRSTGLQFNEQLPFNEDQLFFFKYLKHINIIASNKNTGYNYFTDGKPSLSTSRYSYDKRLIAYYEIRYVYKELLDKFKLPPTVLKKTSSMVCRIYLDAIKSCYAKHEDKNICLDILCNLDKKEFRNLYSPVSLQGKMLKAFILFPNYFIHLILKLIIH